MRAIVYNVYNQIDDNIKLFKLDKALKYGVLLENGVRRISTGYTIIRKIQTGSQEYDNIISKDNYTFNEIGYVGRKDSEVCLSLKEVSEDKGYFDIPFTYFLDKISESELLLRLDDFELRLVYNNGALYLGDSITGYPLSDINKLVIRLNSCTKKNGSLGFKMYISDKDTKSEYSVGFCHVSEIKWRINNSTVKLYKRVCK